MIGTYTYSKDDDKSLSCLFLIAMMFPVLIGAGFIVFGIQVRNMKREIRAVKERIETIESSSVPIVVPKYAKFILD